MGVSTVTKSKRLFSYGSPVVYQADCCLFFCAFLIVFSICLVLRLAFIKVTEIVVFFDHMEIGSRENGACFTSAPLLKRTKFLSIVFIPQLDLPQRRESGTKSGSSGWEHAVKHVNSDNDMFHLLSFHVVGPHWGCTQGWDGNRNWQKVPFSVSIAHPSVSPSVCRVPTVIAYNFDRTIQCRTRTWDDPCKGEVLPAEQPYCLIGDGVQLSRTAKWQYFQQWPERRSLSRPVWLSLSSYGRGQCLPVYEIATNQAKHPNIS